MSVFEELSDEKILELINRGMEYEKLDYKREFNIDRREDIVKLAKDVCAMANSGGGHIIIGIDNNYNKIGFNPDKKIDEADLRNKINSYLEPKVNLYYREFKTTINGKEVKFGVIYVEPANTIVFTSRDGNYPIPRNRTKSEFRKGMVFIRDGSKSRPAEPGEFFEMIRKLVFQQRVDISRQGAIVSRIFEERVKPDNIRETLYINLLKVQHLPETIWSASTEFGYKREVFEALQREDLPPFILKEKKLFTFSDLNNEENPLREIIDVSMISSVKTEDWIKDKNKRNYLIELLNVTLKQYCRTLDLSFDEKTKRYYFTKEIKEFRWRKGGREFRRTVVRHDKKNGIYVHRAVKMRFTILDDEIYLIVDPCLLISYDGYKPAKDEEVKSKYSHVFAGYRNKDYQNDFNFWISFLKGDKPQIQIIGIDYRVNISPKPLNENVNFGIDEEEL